MELKTPLYENHIECKGKIVPFAGYLLPVQYENGVIAEHMAVRTNAGLFDVSHMGEVVISGKDALKNLQMLMTNDFTDMYDGQVRYSPMCNDDGGVVDDLIVYRMSENEYFIVVNAANRHKDVDWMKQHLFGNAELSDKSDTIAQLALQGPRSKDILERCVDERFIPKKYYSFTDNVDLSGIKCLISKTGYTGESGYEIYCANRDASRLWKLLLSVGEKFGLIPCGLGARDTLRLEAAMPLYGHEMNDVITPLETGLSSFVKLDKENFIGKKALENKGVPEVARIGLRILGRGIAREHCAVISGGIQIGETTSGTFCPALKYPAAMALVKCEFAMAGEKLEVEIRGKRVEAEVVSLPFYKVSKK